MVQVQSELYPTLAGVPPGMVARMRRMVSQSRASAADTDVDEGALREDTQGNFPDDRAGGAEGGAVPSERWCVHAPAVGGHSGGC